MYIALKPCQIAGKKYIIDDPVDVSMLTEQEIASLCKKRLIVKAGVEETTPPVPELIVIPVTTEDGTIDVSVTVEQLLAVIALLQLTAEDAEKAIKDVNDDTQLVLIHRLDSRKTVQKAAKGRAEALAKAAEEGNNPTDSNGEGDE